QALLAGLAQIARVAAAAHRIRSSLARAARFGMDHHRIAPPLDGAADQPVVMAFAIARRGVDEIDAKADGAVERRERFGVVGRPIGARHAHAAEPEAGDQEVGLAEALLVHPQSLTRPMGMFSRLPLS